ncbi:inositol monophosphatase family protein [Bacillus massiliglaciei]|uniref:inositol monophosphatase family protein n=1 Tax=Bacillus massiliglaciei TaxID=1816693 RepID=UPI000B318F37|nr:inositol monophosphatase family protein [Bacillus massiliglaciei]
MIPIKEMESSAKQWIREAGQRIIASFTTKINIQAKSNPNDLVTNIDKETEEFFIGKIKERYPGHRILGEEGMGDEVRDLKGVVWIIDPIDGTLNFIHQQRNFAISIGVFEDGIGKFGMVYDVVLDELYHAVKGEGVFLNDVPLSKLTDGKLEESIVSLNASWVTENKRIDHQVLAPLVHDVRGMRSYGSAALELAYVAAGRLDVYITMRLAPWDFAGGVLLVEEAGGEVSNVYGEELDFIDGGSLFVSRPGLHEVILNRYMNK